MWLFLCMNVSPYAIVYALPFKAHPLINISFTINIHIPASWQWIFMFTWWCPFSYNFLTIPAITLTISNTIFMWPYHWIIQASWPQKSSSNGASAKSPFLTECPLVQWTTRELADWCFLKSGENVLLDTENE